MGEILAVILNIDHIHPPIIRAWETSKFFLYKSRVSLPSFQEINPRWSYNPLSRYLKPLCNLNVYVVAIRKPRLSYPPKKSIGWDLRIHAPETHISPLLLQCFPCLAPTPPNGNPESLLRLPHSNERPLSRTPVSICFASPIPNIQPDFLISDSPREFSTPVWKQVEWW